MTGFKILKGSLNKVIKRTLNEIKAFHGTQKDFNRFNHKHFLGQGTGSQVFGWGTYVTDNEEIAKDYALVNDKGEQEYDGRMIYVDGNRFDIHSGESVISNVFYPWARNNYSKLYRIMSNNYKEPTYDTWELLENMLEGYLRKEWTKNNLIDILDNIDKAESDSSQNFQYAILFLFKEFIDNHSILPYFKPQYKIVYEVDIPEDKGANYIEWYEKLPKDFMVRILQGLQKLKPSYLEKIKDNSPAFKRTLGKYLDGSSQKDIETIADEENYQTFFGRFYDTSTGEDVYERLSIYLGSPKASALFLMYCGFDGIKYPSNTIFKDSKYIDRGGMNYVIFDFNKVKITNKTFL